MCAVFAFATANVAKAEDSTVTAEVSVQASVSPKPPIVRPAIKAIESRLQNNGEARNNILEQRREIRGEATSTIKEMRVEVRAEIKDERASTTDMFKRGAEIRKEIAKKMEAKAFEIRKEALVKELNLSLSNITSVSARIDARITKAESEGKTMSEAKDLLATANEKLAKAKTDIAAFAALPAPSASTTVQIDLAKPRVLGDTAIKSVKDARDAFQKVIAAIAHALGADITASSTAEIN